MSIELKQYNNRKITPLDDAEIYDSIFKASGISKGLTITYLGINQIRIGAGRGVIKGRSFVVEEEILYTELSEGATLNGRLSIRMDLADTEEPIKFLLESSIGTLRVLEQNESANDVNGVYEISLATYTIDTTKLNNFKVDYPKIESGLANLLEKINSHTHKYAGSDTSGGAATSAKKLETKRTIKIGAKSNTFDGSEDITFTAGDMNLAPLNHAYTANDYGLGSTTHFGHVKIINGLGQTTYVDGQSLAAYQGYLLANGSARDSTKAAIAHADSTNKFGLGSTSLFGHVKLINTLTQTSYADGTALSAYQGYLLQNTKSESISISTGKTVTIVGDATDESYANVHHYRFVDLILEKIKGEVGYNAPVGLAQIIGGTSSTSGSTPTTIAFNTITSAYNASFGVFSSGSFSSSKLTLKFTTSNPTVIQYNPKFTSVTVA